jgi:NAD(P)-dependent dehydrogenase (short-subunit alcohol dehydrogenase family)
MKKTKSDTVGSESMQTIQNKHILLVGATGGIGQETAKLLVNSQAKLHIAGRNAQTLDKLAADLKIPAERVHQLDIANEQEVAAVAEAIHGQTEALDALINVAGVGVVKPLESLTADDFRKTIDANLLGPFLLLKYFLPNMKEKKEGLIVNLPGVLGKAPMAAASVYAASKYGLNGMLKSVREELRRTNIRITNLYLGGTDTPFWDEDIDIRFQRDKFITSREAARSIWFLCQQPDSGVVSEMVLQPFNHQAI